MEFLEFVKVIGFPAACLIGLAWGVWKALAYVVKNILEPVATRHVQFVAHLEKTQDDRDETSRKQADSLVKLAELQARQSAQLDEQTALLKKIGAAGAVVAKLAVEEHKQGDLDK